MEEYKKIVSFIRELYNQPEGIIPLHAPVFTGNEKKYINECIDSTYVSSVGKYVDLFEDAIAKYTGAKKAVACVNGTSALHLALKLAGVQPGDEVITQPLTFIATANAITYCGAKPVFLDVDMDTMGLSPTALSNWLEQNIIFKTIKPETRNAKHETRNLKPETRNPKPETRNPEPETTKFPFNKNTSRPVSACVPMHTFGHPCHIDEIVEICNHYNIQVVEDAAESLGSYYKGLHTGTFGHIGALSFNGNKIITTGGGGMLLFQSEDLAKYAKHLTTQAKLPHQWEFVHDETGYNYRMPNINAALGLAQLEQIQVFLASKRSIAEEYKDFFSNSSEIFISEPPGAQSNYWLNCILLHSKNERDNFLQYSNENQVMTRSAWQLMNRLVMFRNCNTDDLANAYRLADRLVNIPSSAKSLMKEK
ncbi:MAG TPA: LegC family aminotransferase [Bacteroidales bacterium]|nr:LegC family aminotransferase [Bacteroidales bacterium]